MDASKTQIVTASRLRDGLVVYLTPSGGWSRRIENGCVSHDEASAARLLARAAEAVGRRIVVGPYPIEVAVAGGSAKPVGCRETIRAFGPTIRPDAASVPLG